MLSCKSRSLVLKRLNVLACYSSSDVRHAEVLPPKKVTFKEKFKEIWHGPTFKYWFIGTTAFFSWMTYYGLKTYKKTRIDVEILPPLPEHVRIERKSEVGELCQKYNELSAVFSKVNIKKLSLCGPSASGKTLLVYDFIKYLKDKQRHSIFSLPRSNVVVFLQCDSESSLLISLKAFAAKLKIKPSELEEQLENTDIAFATAPFQDQCNALLQCIQDSLKKHSGWMIVFDNIMSSSPSSVHHILNAWFEDASDAWSSGTVFLIHDGNINNGLRLNEKSSYVMKKGLMMDDAIDLIQQSANLDPSVATIEPIKQLIETVFYNPLALVCVGILLKDNLSRNETVSIEIAVTKLREDIDANLRNVIAANHHMHDFIATRSGMTLVVIETIVAMVMKSILSNDQYLYHGFDLLSTLKPGYAVPQSLLARHFRAPFYKLPPLIQPSNGMAEIFNKQKSDLEAAKNKVDELEPKGKAWSNKNLAEYIRKVEDFFMTGMDTVKDIYNLFYGELPVLPEKPDGLDMFRMCKLLNVSVLEPGGVKAVSMHPLIYNVARQHFLSSSVYRQESEHLTESQLHYHNQPWYRRFQTFSEQACLQKYRMAAGHTAPNAVPPETYLFRYNLGIDISSVFFESPFSTKEGEFWLPTANDKLRYLQSHVTRTLEALCDEISVSKEDVSGRSSQNVLLMHLEYLLDNQPRELLSSTEYMDGLLTVAKCYTDLYKDHAKSKQILEHVLKLQRSVETTNTLDIAKTLGRLAAIHNTLGEYEKAKSLFVEAVEIYEADRRKCGEYKRCFEFGKLLGSLGIVYASLNMKLESKEIIERSLMLKQAVPPDLADEAKCKDFGSDFASSLTDLGHSYVSMGMPLYGKKILDLALSAHKNIHGDKHPEVVRTLTVLGVAHLMQGHNAESKRLRNEAGKLQAALNALPFY